MSIFVIGTSADVRAFRLAGVEGYVCDSRDEVEKCIDDIVTKDADALLIFSPSASGLVENRTAQWRRDGTGPAFEVLPE